LQANPSLKFLPGILAREACVAIMPGLAPC